MNQTPRLRSSYPSTPESTQRSSRTDESSPVPERIRTSLPRVPQPSSGSAPTAAPLIPLNILDAPSQRFYVFAVYIGLLAWRLYDWGNLLEDEADSFWLFIKWVAFDGVFWYGLPAMRIPWLEWSNPVITGIFLAHAILNGMLMFRIPIPIEAGLAAVVKTLYDRELSISENRVKPASILHNSSLIMGKQIINVLPEGSATLNPDRQSFCIDNSRTSIKLPIRLNQTVPISIEIFRLDFDTNANETIEIKQKEIRAMRKQADKKTPKGEILTLEYPIKKPGLYRLLRVVDESKLDVQRRISDTLVVKCPRASMKPSTTDRCIGDLSDLTIDVEGIPPLKIAYSRTINSKDQSFHLQSIQPENLVSPLTGSSSALTLISRGNEDISWAKSQLISVRLNESTTSSGKWLYSIDEVHDATGNVANFSARGEDGEHIYPKGSHLEQGLTVHERPQVRLEGCDSNKALRVAKGKSTAFPIRFGPLGRTPDDAGHVVTWEFSPIDTLTAEGGHGSEVVLEEFVSKNAHQKPNIERPGLYTIKSVRNQFCEGEVREPASCLLINPPEPDLTITSEDIYDKCAGSSIGLRLDLDLIGTPPFTVYYEVEERNSRPSTQRVEVSGSRHQLELKPETAGHFTYRFTRIDDQVYRGHALNPKDLTLEQDVKPPASAHLMGTGVLVEACIGEPVKLDIFLSGEPPFTLEYELLHDGKRVKQKLKGLDPGMHEISTGPLLHGGAYSLALTSVQDSTGCKIFLNQEVKIRVRPSRPKVSFGQVEGKRSTLTLEGREIELPLRLEGVSPWKVSFRNVNDSTGKIVEREVNSANGNIKIDTRGTYELVSVNDATCPGTVEASASTFDVGWIARPELKISNLSGVIPDGKKYVKREVCESDVDSMEVNLIGSPPYHLKYQQRHKPHQGSQSMINKEIDVALGVATIAMGTTKAGIYTYMFSELADNAYDHEPDKFAPLIVEQTVNPKPSARFLKPGQSYKYCKEEEAGDEVIPISLQGLPPFSLEIDIKHQSSSRPETVKIANVETNQYDFRIPHRVLSLGTHQVSVRKVRDANGCQQKTEYGAPHVQVQVFDVPTIYPLESRVDYCVGDRISYTLSGTPPFEIYYTFEGIERKAKSPNTNFKRIAEKPGVFTIKAVSDKASECKANVEITKTIHEMPSVKLSKGKQVSVDIHEGGEAEILFEFWGTPPFEFTYTRSTNAKKGHKSQVLETRHDISYEHSKIIQASQEGTYEVVAIKDNFCAFSTQRVEGKGGQKLLKY